MEKCIALHIIKENGKTVLTKDMSNMIKGIAVLMMLAHHLWGFPSRIQAISMPSICVQIGEAFKICVTIFMFLSGFGLYATWKSHRCLNVWKRVWNTYRNFWRVFWIFVPVGLLFYGVDFHIGEFFGNLFCLTYSYNHEWWFLGTYIELLMVLPWILKFEHKRIFLFFVVLSAVAFRASAEILFTSSGGVLQHLFNFGYYFPAFMLGVLFAKWELYEHLVIKFKAKKSFCLCVMVIVFCLLIRKKFDETAMTIVMVPAVIYVLSVVMNIVKKANVMFRTMGKHSMNMWLIHSFFIYYYWQDLFVVITHNAIVAYLMLIILSYFSSIVINSFWNMVNFGVDKLMRKR